MVDGINMVFKKDLFIEILKKNGMEDQITDEIIKEMDNLDGQPVTTASWDRQVNDMPVYSCLGKDGRWMPVHEDACVPA